MMSIYSARQIKIDVPGISRYANGIFAKKFMSIMIYRKRRCVTNANGVAHTIEKLPMIPASVPIPIANGTAGKIKIFAGNATRENTPIL